MFIFASFLKIGVSAYACVAQCKQTSKLLIHERKQVGMHLSRKIKQALYQTIISISMQFAILFRFFFSLFRFIRFPSIAFFLFFTFSSLSFSDSLHSFSTFSSSLSLSLFFLHSFSLYLHYLSPFIPFLSPISHLYLSPPFLPSLSLIPPPRPFSMTPFPSLLSSPPFFHLFLYPFHPHSSLTPPRFPLLPPHSSSLTPFSP